MDIRKTGISGTYMQKQVKSLEKAAESMPGDMFTSGGYIPRRNFAKMPVNFSSGNPQKAAKTDSPKQPVDIDGLKQIGDLEQLKMTAHNSAVHHKSGDIITSLEHIHNREEKFLARFDKIGRIKWCVKAPKARSVIATDEKGNLAYRHENGITMFDPDGNQKWDYKVDRNDHYELKINPVAIGPDESVHFFMQIPGVKYSNGHNPKDEDNIRLFKVKDGKEQWHFDTRAEYLRPKQVFVAKDGAVIINDERKKFKLFGGNETQYRIVGLDPDGKKKFTIKTEPRDYDDEPNFTQHPDGTMYACIPDESSSLHTRLTAFDTNGKEKWTIFLPRPKSFWHEDGMFIKHRPVFDKNGNTYIVAQSKGSQSDNCLICLRKSNNVKLDNAFELAWRFESGPGLGAPRLDDKTGNLYVGDGRSEIHVFKPDTGEKVRSIRIDKSYGLSDATGVKDGACIFSTNDGSFLMYNRDEGLAAAIDSLKDGGKTNGQKPAVVEEKEYVIIDGVKLEKND